MTALTPERIAELRKIADDHVGAWPITPDLIDELISAYESLQAEHDEAVDTCLDLRKRLSGYEALRAEAWRLRDALRYAIDYSNDRGVIAEARRALAEGRKT